MRQIALFLLIFSCLLDSRTAQAAALGDVLPGARPAAMGRAYTALSDDVFGMFYNPAGMANSNFTQVGGTVGRMLSPDGNVAMVAGAYSRPFPILPGATVGAGFMNVQQSGTEAEKSEFLMHFSHSIKIPQIRLPRPMQYGGNVKIRQAVPGRSKKVNKVGLGLDVGALYDSGGTWQAGMAIKNLESGVGLPTPELALGAVYRWRKKINFATDIHVRGGLAEISPGIEMDVLQRLLKVRFGKGLSLDGQKQISTGLGINYSPVIIDFNMNIPFKGLNHPSGAYQISLTYKFGAPPFYGRFVGESAREAEDLRGTILGLEERKKTLESQVEAARSENTGLEGQVQAREGRLRELENRIRQLEYNYDKKTYNAGHPKPEPPQAPQPKAKPPAKPKAQGRTGPITHPGRHLVKPGDTLRKLADIYYKDATMWELIYDANPEKIERGLPIEGAVLRIPVPRKR